LIVTVLALVAATTVAAVSGVVDVGGRLASARPEWLLLATGLELASVFGFIATVQLVFGEWLPKRLSLRMGLVVRAATIVAPGGGLAAVGIGAKALGNGRMQGKLAPRAIAFLLLTNAPNFIALGLFGTALGAGLLSGPNTPVLTFVPAAIGFATIGATLLIPKVSKQRSARVPPSSPRRAISGAARALELGVIEARSLVAGRSWKLLGAGAYYAADNAVLWATFSAFGHVHPPVALFAMAYLIGSAAGSVPVPAGIGVVEGGMIGLLALYGAPALCAAIAVLAYRAISIGLPLALGGLAFLGLFRRVREA
jgi:uncharacterized membrane protein YbhN (UPF0104 family)